MKHEHSRIYKTKNVTAPVCSISLMRASRSAMIASFAFAMSFRRATSSSRTRCSSSAASRLRKCRSDDFPARASGSARASCEVSSWINFSCAEGEGHQAKARDG